MKKTEAMKYEKLLAALEDAAGALCSISLSARNTATSDNDFRTAEGKRAAWAAINALTAIQSAKD